VAPAVQLLKAATDCTLPKRFNERPLALFVTEYDNKFLGDTENWYSLEQTTQYWIPNDDIRRQGNAVENNYSRVAFSAFDANVSLEGNQMQLVCRSGDQCIRTETSFPPSVSTTTKSHDSVYIHFCDPDHAEQAALATRLLIVANGGGSGDF
jgi:hypothetical protein